MDRVDKPLKLVIEAFLFASDKPISAHDINGWLPDENPADIKKMLMELHAEYDEMKRSFDLVEVAQGYQLRTRSEYAPYILRMLKTRPTRLSRAAMETLSIIAYKQPVLRHEMEEIRGVDVGGILRTLMEKDLIRIMGRKNLPGRPLIYGTTRKFLEVFNLKNLDSLPKMKEIKDLAADEEGTRTAPDGDQQTEAPDQENSSHDEEKTGDGPIPAPEA